MTIIGGEPAQDRKYWYKIFGLIVGSEYELPEASCPLPSPSIADTECAVEIRRGAAPESLPEARQLADWIQVGSHECLFTFEGVCRILVSHGKSIVVDEAPGVAESDVRAYLFGSALGTIVHQRRLVPLHISMVQTPFGNIAFTGPSGAGKSTIAAALQKFNDWAILCDDMAVFDSRSEPAMLHTGVRHNKLWRDAIDELELSDREMVRDLSRTEKFHLFRERDPEASTAPFRYLFELSWGDGISIREVSPSARFRILMNAVYRPYMPALTGTLSEVQTGALILSRTVRAFYFVRPRALSRLRDVAATMLEHCKQA